MSIIVGISAYYHDSAVAIFKNNKLVFAAHEERYSRIKHDSAFPVNALKAGMRHLDIRPDQIECYVFYEKPLRKFDRIFETVLANWPFGFGQFKIALNEWFGGKLNHRKKIIDELNSSDIQLPPSTKVYFSEHHLSHGALAAFGSKFREATVIVLDAVGEWESGTIWVYSQSEELYPSFKKLEALYFPHSVGMLYSALTAFLGFKVNSGEYKVMGLAPYGNPIFAEKIKERLLLGTGRKFALNMDAFVYQKKMAMFDEKIFFEVFGITPRDEQKPVLQIHCDIAASLQVVLNDTVNDIVTHAISITEKPNVCLAGGVALNCVTNSYVLKNNPKIDKMFIHPASGDAGGAAGAAAAHIMINHKQTPNLDETAFLGSEYDYNIDEIKKYFSKEKVKIEKFEDKKLFRLIAKQLSLGKIVGWHRGRSEYGPRALGHRSILASPLIKNAQTKVNLKIKYREGFRPFAPIVTSTEFDKYFEGTGDFRFMLQTATVKSFQSNQKAIKDKNDLSAKLSAVNSLLPAITHVDGSARVQTVKENSDIGCLLNAFKEITGFPVLINTSFNVRGEPPVESPVDAIKCFLSCEMDILVLGNFMVTKVGVASRTLFNSFEAD